MGDGGGKISFGAPAILQAMPQHGMAVSVVTFCGASATRHAAGGSSHIHVGASVRFNMQLIIIRKY